jgi:hypothetical protein
VKGSTPTKAEKELWSRMAGLGCVACLQDGIRNSLVSIHHIDGRTKPGAHKKVLPLCAPHHQQDDTDPMHRIAVHPNKAKFERQYGTQIELLHQVMLLLGRSHA